MCLCLIFDFYLSTSLHQYFEQVRFTIVNNNLKFTLDSLKKYFLSISQH